MAAAERPVDSLRPPIDLPSTASVALRPHYASASSRVPAYFDFDAGNRDMPRASKAKGTPAPPRRQPIIGREDAVCHNSKLPPYLTYKKENRDNFKNPGQTRFLTTRCPWL